MHPLPSFEQELKDVEEFLALHAPSDSELQSMDESTVVEVEIDPANVEERQHLVNPVHEPKLTRETLIQRSDAHPLVLSLMLFDRFEESWLTWDTEALIDEVSSLYGTPHPVNLGKLSAAQAAYTKTAAWEEWHYFLLTLQAFNDEMVDPDHYRPPTVEEVGVAVDMLRLIDDKSTYSLEVQTFNVSVLRWHQWLYPPDNLEKAVPPGTDLHPCDSRRVELMRKHPDMIDESLEGFFASRLHEYDLHMQMMRKRLQQQLAVVRRAG